MRMRLLEEWNSFAAKVLPPNCPPVERQKMRRAFYAGSACIMDKLAASMSDDTEATEADLQVLTEFHQELLMFAKDMKEGRA